MTRPNWVDAILPHSCAAISTLLSTRWCNNLPDIGGNEIGRHNFTFVGSWFGLGIMTHVACFDVF